MSKFTWCIDIPTEWKVGSLRWTTKIYSGGTPEKNMTEYWEEGTIPWLPSGCVNQKKIYRTDSFITEEGFKNSSAKWIPAKSLVIALAGQGKTKGTVATLEFSSTCNQSLAAIIPNEEVDYLYLYYYLDSNYSNIRSLSGDGLRDGLNLQILADISIPIPPKKIQRDIASFLDRKTAEIDALITDKQRINELLQQQRQSIIYETVTKGLNPNAPMKDSGVEWIGYIPANWSVVPLTKFLESRVDYRGKTPTKVDEGVFLVTAYNIKDGSIDYSASQEYVSRDEYEEIMRRGKPEVGDVLLTTEAPLGEVANVDNPDIALAQRVIKFRGNKQLDNYFLKYWMSSYGFQSFIKSLATGSTAEGIKASKLFMLRLVLPDINEQKEIVTYLDGKINEIRNIENINNKIIEELKRYRQSLICEVVTGKKEV